LVQKSKRLASISECDHDKHTLGSQGRKLQMTKLENLKTRKKWHTKERLLLTKLLAILTQEKLETRLNTKHSNMQIKFQLTSTYQGD